MTHSVLQRLRAVGRSRLAAILEAEGGRSLRDYSRGLNTHTPRRPMERALSDSFGDHARALGLADPDVESYVAELERFRVLQTATHLTASEGATFLAVHRAATVGMPPGRRYVVGAYSDVPFSNPAWSGCLNHGPHHVLEDFVQPTSRVYGRLRKDALNRARDTPERRISLIPSCMREVRVHRASIPDRMRTVLSELQPPLAALVPSPEGPGFSSWALRFCQNVSQRLFPGLSCVYLDLNEVVSRYLIRILDEQGHPLYRLFTDPLLRQRVMLALKPDAPWFSVNSSRGARVRREGLVERDGMLLGSGVVLSCRPDTLREGLVSGVLCPGLALTFICLAFLNGFRCLGSFEQVEYLGRLREGLLGLGWLDRGSVQDVDVTALTAGRCVGAANEPIFPLDLVLSTPFALPGEVTVWDWFEPLLGRVLDRH